MTQVVGNRNIVSSVEAVLGALNGAESLNLFPTENRMSPAALAALATDAAHRYQFSEGADSFYGDTGILAELIDCCDDLAREYFSSNFAITTGLSGLNAMHAVLTSFADAGDLALAVHVDNGGHYATETVCRKYGMDVAFLPYAQERCDFDYDAIEVLAARRKPKVIYLDTSTLLKLPSMPRLRSAVGADPIICFDASQVLALVPAFPELIGPASGADVVSGSTHKTIPGPQKGLILTNNAAAEERLLANIPFYVSNPHVNAVGALAITLAELMPHRMAYARDMIANANSLASALAAAGLRVPFGEDQSIETQQVWIEASSVDEALDWARQLRRANIRSTAVPLPSAKGRSGLRLGVQELTRLGMGPADMAEVAHLLAGCLLGTLSLEDTKRQAIKLARCFTGLKYISVLSSDSAKSAHRREGAPS